jgi:uroporphyrinogen decarboxylase
MPYSKTALNIAKRARVCPSSISARTRAACSNSSREAGGDVIGVDWRMPLDVAWQRVGDAVAVQGNLDPVALLAPWDELEAPRSTEVLDEAVGAVARATSLTWATVFSKQTPMDNVRRLVDFVCTSQG